MAAHSSLLHASFCVCWRQPKISSRCVPKNKRERDGCCVYLNPLYFPSSVLYSKSLIFPNVSTVSMVSTWGMMMASSYWMMRCFSFSSHGQKGL
jgi:hypothetical protein